MKPKTFSSGPWLIALLALGVSFALVSWDHKQFKDRPAGQTANDTIPKSIPKVRDADRDKKIRDLDDVLQELNSADLNLHMEKVQKEIEEAMKRINNDQIRLEMEKAMKEVDFDRIRKEVEESISKIDWNQMKREIDESMVRIDWDKVKKELDQVKNMNLDRLNLDMQQLQEELKDLGPRVKREMEKAGAEIEKAKTEMREYKEFVDGLQSDGLINKKEDYTIKHKNGELTVNGQRVSNAVYSKYRAFLEKHKTFSIEKNNDDFNIDND